MTKIAIVGLVMSGLWAITGFIELWIPWLRSDLSGRETFIEIIKALAFFVICLYFTLRGLK